MAGKTVDGALHASPPDVVVEPSLEQHFNDNTDGVQRRAGAEQDECDREDLVAASCARWIAVANRRDGDDRLIQRVERIEAEQHITRRAGCQDDREHREAGNEPLNGLKSTGNEAPPRSAARSLSAARLPSSQHDLHRWNAIAASSPGRAYHAARDGLA